MYVKTYEIACFRYAVYCTLLILQSCKENGHCEKDWKCTLTHKILWTQIYS